MKIGSKVKLAAAAAAIIATGALVWPARADDNDDAIKEIMKVYHKAPKGVDPVCKKAGDGHATPEELKNLVLAYKKLATTKPPQGDEAGWKEKTSKLFAASQDLESGKPGAAEAYKKAVDCKGCHSVYKPK
jgi:cytochrome c556